MNNYFPHDSNSRNSDKLLPVRMKYGAEGYGIYFMILERLREEKNYMSVKDYNMLAFDLRVDTSKLKAIVEDFGLFAFTEDGECFYSEGFNKRMEIMEEKSRKKSEAGKKGAAKRWQKNSSAIAEPLAKDSEANAVAKEKNSNKTKPNKTKEKENKINSRSSNSNLSQLIDFYENNFGKMPPLVLDDLNYAYNDYGYELTLEAMKRAVRQQKNFRTALNILDYWSRNGVKTLADAEAESKAFNQRKKQAVTENKVSPKAGRNVPEWTDEGRLIKAGVDTTGMTQNEMYKLAGEMGLHDA
ncbi:DnaD domain protein [Lactococcus lactis]|uniref:DnaD/phage-associated family protein n=1 Tax=Lactococcus lactis TaxID=1358 RepID=A0AAW5TJY5_9LACT|nr:DnaD domain protein [Lactococcus lactis]MCW2280437.1 DnaD/phage-associated family protein [Lactococcus lactis]MCW2281470.1 DnaD/phage-associated family protein [Lactococcus lactis]